MAETSPTPATRRQLLVVHTTITRAGQYEPIEVRLPASATRVTGISAVATPLPAQVFERRDAFVVFAPAPDANHEPELITQTTVTRVPGSVDIGQFGARLEQVLLHGWDMAAGIDAYDPNRHVGFYQPLTDELPLQLLDVPAGKEVYYGQTVALGLPKLVNSLGEPLELFFQQNRGAVATLFTRFAYEGTPQVKPFHSTLAFLCWAKSPKPRPSYAYTDTDTGYYDGILFPGDPDRY